MNTKIFVVRVRTTDQKIRFVVVTAWNAVQAEEIAGHNETVALAMVVEG